jgi:hypothetical protein
LLSPARFRPPAEAQSSPQSPPLLGNTGLRHPHALGWLLRDVNTADIHQVMSDAASEHHGGFRQGLPADPQA